MARATLAPSCPRFSLSINPLAQPLLCRLLLIAVFLHVSLYSGACLCRLQNARSVWEAGAARRQLLQALEIARRHGHPVVAERALFAGRRIGAVAGIAVEDGACHAFACLAVGIPAVLAGQAVIRCPGAADAVGVGALQGSQEERVGRASRPGSRLARPHSGLQTRTGRPLLSGKAGQQHPQSCRAKWASAEPFRDGFRPAREQHDIKKAQQKDLPSAGLYPPACMSRARPPGQAGT